MMRSEEGNPSQSSESSSKEESEHVDVEGCNFGLNPIELPYLWYPNQESVNQFEYVRRLEYEFTCLQHAFLALTTQFARLQFRVRQIVQASPCERDALLLDLEHMAFNPTEETDELPPIERDAINMGDVRCKQSYIIERLRQQLCTLAEAESLQPIPELDAEPPALDSIDEMICCCVKNKHKSPPLQDFDGPMSSKASPPPATTTTNNKGKTETQTEALLEGRSPTEKVRSSWVMDQLQLFDMP